MNDFLKKLQSRKNETLSFFSRDKEKIGITSHRDWIILIVLFSVSVILVALLGIFLFLKTIHNEFVIINEITLDTPQIITADEFLEGLGEYRAKELRMEELLLKEPFIVDPS